VARRGRVQQADFTGDAVAELIEYPPLPYENEDRLSWERRALNPWRMEQKRKLFAKRGPMCEREGCDRAAEDLDDDNQG